MKCKLCQKDSPLQNSHIIPEFVYRQLYDEKHRMHVLSSHEKSPRPYEQKGLREKLLCRNCEARFSEYERYASTAFDGKETETPLDGVLIIKDVDYNKFKLFLLSILWRSSVSSLDFFSQVSLGPHENKIREMILSNDPGPSDKYGVIPFALIDDSTIRSDLIMQPSRTKLYGHVGYRFIFGGFMWAFLVSGHLPPREMKPLFLMEDNTLCILKGD
jgi:hypothetical protein